MGLQVWLQLNGNLDNHGLADDLILTSGTAMYKVGKIGQGLDLNSRISFNCQTLSGLTKFSVAFWAKVEDNTSLTTNWQDIIGFTDQKADNSATGQIRAETCYNYSLGTGIHWHDNTTYAIEMDDFSNHYSGDRGIWHHCVLAVDSNVGCSVYTDGNLIKTTNNPQGGHITGAFWLGETNNIAGCINDVRIYDHVLSPREVKELSKGLVLHYSLAMPGQENLLVPQISDNHWTNWGSSAWNTNNTREKIVGDDGKTWAHIIQNTTDGYGGYACDPAYNNIVIDSSKRYTWSCIAKSGTKENAEIVLWCHWRSTEGGSNLSQNTKKFLLTSNSQRISWTLPQYTNTTYTVNRINLMMGTYGTGNNEIYFTDVKFEEGEIATPWLPNPADPLYSSLGFNDGVEYDVSGYGNNGTKVGTITYDADTPRYNTSAYFNGSSDIRSAKSSFGWFDFKEGTVAAWFKPANTTQTWASVGVQNDGGTGSRSFSICNYSGKAATVVGYDSSWGSYSSDYSMSANVWYHLCATITNGDTVKLYVNGELVQTRTVTNTTGTIASTTQFAVGVDLPGSDERYTGHLSDVRFYTTCLNESDVRELYNTSMSLSNNGVLFGYEFIE